jgi:hypothetical protein
MSLKISFSHHVIKFAKMKADVKEKAVNQKACFQFIKGCLLCHPTCATLSIKKEKNFYIEKYLMNERPLLSVVTTITILVHLSRIDIEQYRFSRRKYTGKPSELRFDHNCNIQNLKSLCEDSESGNNFTMRTDTGATPH